MEKKKRLTIAVALVILLAFLIFIIVRSGQVSELTVTFDSHGGTEVETIEIKRGETLEEPPTPTKEGYQFIGWYYDGKKFDFDSKIEEDIELEAKWIKVDTIKYTVKFDSAGGTSIQDLKVEKGKTIKEPTKPTKKGYTFVGWTLNGASFDFNSKIEKNITLVATWRKNETLGSTINQEVTVDKPATSTGNSNVKPEEKPNETPVETPNLYQVHFMDGSVELSTAFVTEGNLVAVPNTPKKDNYLFVAWVSNNQVFDFSTPITGDTYVYAIWTKVLNSVQSITNFEQVLDPTEDPTGNIVYNQKSIEISQVGSIVTVTKKRPLHAYTNASTLEKEWFAMILDFDIDPNQIEIEGYQINAEDISEAKRFGAITDTAFIVWLDAVDRVLNVKANGKELGSVSIQIVTDYPGLELKDVTKLPTVDPSETELVHNNDSITVLKEGNTITVTEHVFMKSFQHGTFGNWYGLVFDFGYDPDNIDTNGLEKTDATLYGATSDTAFVLWLEGKTIDDTRTITFTNVVDSSEVEVTIQFKAKEGVHYEANGAITDVVDATYHEDRNAFEIESDVTSFTFQDDGVKMIATLGNQTWEFKENING